jgi:hypothetical protein
MEAESLVLKVMPGNEIEWEVEVFSQSRLVHVWAVITKESESQVRQRLILGGEVYSFEKTGEGRNNHAVLNFSEEYSDPIEVGDYRLSSMTCVTSSGPAWTSLTRRSPRTSSGWSANRTMKYPGSEKPV